MLLTFDLVSASAEPAKVILNPAHIETVVDGKPFHQQDVTQVTMISGTKFFIKHSFAEVTEILKNLNP